MANEYLYGAYGHIGETVAQSAVQAGTTPVYIGTAPVNLVRGFGKAGVINAPIKITSLVDAQKKLGYAADWGTFTLCEVMYAHFNNTLGNIGPIYVINVLDPSEGKHRKEEATTKTLAFTGGRAEFASSTVILDTLTIAKATSGNYVEGSDYAVDYNFTKGTVIITSLKDDAQLTGNLTATFYEVDDSVEDSDIIGGVTSSGEYSGLSAIALLYPEQFAVCNLIAAPGWSHSPAVYNAMLTASQKINGHWDAFVVADLPLVDSTAQAVDTITKAIAWKKANAFTGERSKVYWPQAVDNLGNVFHLSTLAVVELMRADFSHNSVPMETCGNKAMRTRCACSASPRDPQAPAAPTPSCTTRSRAVITPRIPNPATRSFSAPRTPRATSATPASSRRWTAARSTPSRATPPTKWPAAPTT